MPSTRTFGRLPTLGEMKEYYARDDVLSFLYDECQMRNVDVAFRRKRWPINPTSKAHLREIIQKTIADRIERAYRNSDDPVDSARLEKFDYLSFHSRTSITSGEKLIGFDTIFEADMQGWRRAFEDLCGVINVLNDFGVCYRIKYSGVRSLHFMIPFESLPKQFNGEPVLGQRAEIQRRLQEYFQRHCGMEKAHGGGVMRLAYSLNEDNGLVSMPISPDELSLFRPWETNIYSVIMDKPWHGDIPSGVSRNMLKFLREVYNENAKAKRKSRKTNRQLEIAPKERSGYSVGVGTVEEWRKRLKSNNELDRIEAAWNLMVTPETVPISVIEEGLIDENPDVRWYMTEALQKHLDTDAVKLAGKMLWDDDQFVRISAIDALVLSSENTLKIISDSFSDSIATSMGAINDIIYTINRICPEDGTQTIQSFIESSVDSVARFVENIIDSDMPFWRARNYVRGLRNLCKDHGVDEVVLFRGAIETLVPKLLMLLSKGELEPRKYWVLKEIRRNQAILLMTMREIADSLGIDDVKIPSNRMTDEERMFLTQVIRESLSDMTLEQKARILHAFWRHYSKKIGEPAGKLLLSIKRMSPSVTRSIDKWAEEKPARSIAANRELVQDKSVDELVGMLGGNWSVRIPAIHALAEKCSTDEDIEKVVSALQAKSTKARTGAVTALGLMMPRHKRARDVIVEALGMQDRTSGGHTFPRWDVRRTAIKVYVRSEPPDAVDVLLHAIDNWHSATARHDAVAELRRYVSEERVQSKLREIVADQRFPLRARIKAGKILQQTPL